jgi:hypothetical protein
VRVFYSNRRSLRRNALPEGSDDALELLWDNWDDFGYQTSFVVVCRVKGAAVGIGSIKVLVEGASDSSAALEKMREDGWDGVFPAPTTGYISVPSDITFYQQLRAQIGAEETKNVATALRDASYLTRVLLDERALTLTNSSGFRKSLQRERGSVKAYLDGWKIIESQAIAVSNFEFKFTDVFQRNSTITLNFDSGSLLPHDINVMIGPNGVGKSRVLHQFVQSWLAQSEKKAGFSEKPNLSQVVVVSYSPFEKFPVDTQGLKLQDTDVYRYFGFRGRSGSEAESPPPIRVSLNHPRRNAVEALISCVADDQKYGAIEGWARKVNTMEKVLRSAFQFDFAAVEIERTRRSSSMYENFDNVEGPTYVHTQHDEGKRKYIPIAVHSAKHLKPPNLTKAVVPESGVLFFLEGEPIELSSGQRLFAYIVINILGAIRRNSLILVDEPELFLHPTLEIQFINMLKEILVDFNSKALMATHSEVTVREVPADCVHVFQRTDDGLVINRPPFQTFGADVQRISSYVFGDNAISKPFERWITSKYQELGSADALIEALGDELNEELLVQIKSMDRRGW